MELSISEHSTPPKKLGDKMLVLETPSETDNTNRDEEGIPDQSIEQDHV